MSRYAQNTSVTSEKSRAEIERTVARYGADSFAYMSDRDRAAVGFALNDRRVRFVLPLPDPYSKAFTHTPERGIERSEDQRASEYDKAVRQKWRALALCIKAKLEAVESDITTFDEEFLAHIVLPGGATIAERLLPQLDHAYETGELPPLLPGPS